MDHSPPEAAAAPPEPRFLPVGDTALSVEFGNAVSPVLNEAVIDLDIALAASEIDGIVETVPSYRSLLVCYEPVEISFHELVAELRRLLARRTTRHGHGATLWDVPVVYDPPFADDLAELAQRLALSEQEVIALHTGADYHVYAVGYAPGMPYLGGVPPALHISRRQVPRPQVPAGAVMIGGIQGAIVPTTVPSAWYKLGQTPLCPFDPHRQDPFLFRPGDHVRFRRIDAEEFRRLASLRTDALLSLVRVPA
ncbi:MAG: 5-oxoprolinase subunit PxpB [Acetobacteraceae bacterium]